MNIQRLDVPLAAPMSAAIADLHRVCFARAWRPAEVAAVAAMPGAFAAIAGEAQHLSGFVLGRSAADEAEIVSLAVHPALRRRGVGFALLSSSAVFAASAGAVALFVDVADDNAAARALYDKVGFQEVGRRPGYYEDGRRDAIVMKRSLGALSSPDQDLVNV